MKFAYSREISDGGCEVLLKTRSEVEPYAEDERGTNLHLVMTTGHQDLCPVGVYRYDFRSSWRSWTSIIPGCEPYRFAAKEFMSDVLRLPCEWIAKNRNIVVELKVFRGRFSKPGSIPKFLLNPNRSTPLSDSLRRKLTDFKHKKRLLVTFSGSQLRKSSELNTIDILVHNGMISAMSIEF